MYGWPVSLSGDITFPAPREGSEVRRGTLVGTAQRGRDDGMGQNA